MRRVLLIPAVLLLLPGLASLVHAQADSTPETVVVELVPGADTDSSVEAYERVVRDAIQVVLERRGRRVILPEIPMESGEEVPHLRYEYNLVGFLPRLHVAITVRDPGEGTRIAGALAAARGNITLYSSVDEVLDALEPAIERYFARTADPDGSPRPVVLVDELVLPAASRDIPQLQYTELNYGTVLPGTGEFVLARDVTLPIRVTRAGYYPREMLLPITGARPELPEVQLQRQRRFGAQLHYGYPRLLGASLGGRYYVVPDRTYLGVETGIHMSGFFGTTPTQLVHLDPRLLFGFLPLGARDRLIQPVASTGVGLVVTFLTPGDDPIPPYVDWYWNVVNLGAEFGRQLLRFYFRVGISYYMETDRGIWEKGINPDKLAPETILGTVLRW